MRASRSSQKDLLDRCGSAPPAMDRENRFFFEDFDRSGKQNTYLRGGQRNLAVGELDPGRDRQEARPHGEALRHRCPRDHMHIGATGLPPSLAQGRKSQVWMLKEAARGEY